MTDHHEPDLASLDDTARAASRGLHDHVARRVDPEIALATLPAAPRGRRRGRFVAVAAATALLVGSVVVLGDQPGDDRSRLELDEDGDRLPTPKPGTLTALGPSDGRDSIQLPVTIEPTEGLRDGDVVTASSPGFEPGEQVGIVQCAKEAGGDTREERGGADACNLGQVEYATADADGVANGQFTVRRVLTTPLTGTVDCATEAERCLVGMGALSDYDRSGGMGFTIAGGEPIDVPALVVTPADQLADGDLVRVEGAGYAPGTFLTLSVCAKDPAACWNTGADLELDAEQVRELGLGDMSDGGSMQVLGLLADAQGRVEGEVPVWRFLPGSTPGTYVDCAVSRCSLRASSSADATPPPVTLDFVGGGDGPTPPAVAVDPADDLAPGDTVVIRGAGFEPDRPVYATLCLAAPDSPDSLHLGSCIGGGEGVRTDEDGTFAFEFVIPDPEQLQDQGMPTTTSCADPAACAAPARGAGATCDGTHAVCLIHVDSYDETIALRPHFPPAPVPVTFRG